MLFRFELGGNLYGSTERFKAKRFYLKTGLGPKFVIEMVLCQCGGERESAQRVRHKKKVKVVKLYCSWLLSGQENRSLWPVVHYHCWCTLVCLFLSLEVSLFIFLYIYNLGHVIVEKILQKHIKGINSYHKIKSINFWVVILHAST